LGRGTPSKKKVRTRYRFDGLQAACMKKTAKTKIIDT